MKKEEFLLYIFSNVNCLKIAAILLKVFLAWKSKKCD